MPLSRLISFWTVLTVSAACASERVAPSPIELPNAVATAACGPTDGPAVAIYLSPNPVKSFEPPAPYVRVYVWQPLDSVHAGRRIIGAGESDGSAWLHSSASDYEIATSGVLTVSAVNPDSTIVGSADLTFPNAGRVRAAFQAAWVPRPVLCG